MCICQLCWNFTYFRSTLWSRDHLTRPMRADSSTSLYAVRQIIQSEHHVWNSWRQAITKSDSTPICTKTAKCVWAYWGMFTKKYDKPHQICISYMLLIIVKMQHYNPKHANLVITLNLIQIHWDLHWWVYSISLLLGLGLGLVFLRVKYLTVSEFTCIYNVLSSNTWSDLE